jgi:hypothetical protein
MSLAVRIVFCLALLPVAVHAQDRCSRDSDCQSGRVCSLNVCAPPPPPPDEPSALPPAPDTASYGGTERPKPKKETHDGFYLHLDLGLGYLTSSATQNGVDASIYGAAGEFGFAIGGALRPHHILALHLWDVAAQNPTVSLNGSPAATDATFSIFCIGPQYTYYAAYDLFLSVTPALSRLDGQSSGGEAQSNFGFGLQLAFGKEWKVSERWGLGAVGQLTFGVNDDSTPNPPTFTTFGFTVAFSATYN